MIYCSPLIAARGLSEDIAIVECLIQAGVNVNMVMEHGNYESSCRSYHGLRDNQIMKALVDASADVNQPLRRAEYPSLVAAATAAAAAAAAGEEKIDILRCLLAAGANVDPSLEEGEYREALEAAQGLQDSDDSDADMGTEYGAFLMLDSLTELDQNRRSKLKISCSYLLRAERKFVCTCIFC